MTVDSYCHPLSGEPLRMGKAGHLYDQRGRLAFESHDGSYDFVVDASSQKEREHYETTYADGGWYPATESLDVLDYHKLWDLEPGCLEYLRSIGDTKGKKMLLIGNGTSIKEFLFVAQGAHITFTDLSFQGVMYAKHRYKSSRLDVERPNACEFHAVNAYYLPFEDNTFDIICADAVVHHLEDLKKLFTGIHRCLKPGGFCRFADSGLSPLWQSAKKGVLRPLQKYCHRKCGISPEDQRATERGGYTHEELEQLKTELGFKSLYYRRVAFLDYLLWRAHCKFNARWVLVFRPALRMLDQMLTKASIMDSQGISLVFGFEK